MSATICGLYPTKEEYNRMPPCMGKLHGGGGGDPSSDRDEGNLWDEIYPIQRIGKSEDGADPFIGLHESKEACNLEMEEGNHETPLSIDKDI